MRPSRGRAGRSAGYSMTTPFSAGASAGAGEIGSDAKPAAAAVAAAAAGGAAAAEPWDRNIGAEFEGCDANLMQQFAAPAPADARGGGGGSAAHYPNRRKTAWAPTKPVVPSPVVRTRVGAAEQAKTHVVAVQTTASEQSAALDKSIAAIRSQVSGRPGSAAKLEDQPWMIAQQERALIDAARKGQLDSVEKLLGDNGNPNCVDDKGCTPLIRAAGEGYVAIVQALIKSGARVDTTGDYKSPLLESVTHGHQDCARVLLEHGALADQVVEPSKHTGLLAAAMHGQVECVKLMLEYKADFKAIDVKGRTALMLAGFMGSHESVRVLVEAGAEIEACCQIGRTGFLWSCSSGPKATDAVEVFLQAGCSVDVRDKEGNGWEGRTKDLQGKGGQAAQPTCKQSVAVIEAWLDSLRNTKAAAAEQELLAMLEKEEEDAAGTKKKAKKKKSKQKKKKAGPPEAPGTPAAAGTPVFEVSGFGGRSPPARTSPPPGGSEFDTSEVVRLQPMPEPEPEPEPEPVLEQQTREPQPEPELTAAAVTDPVKAARHAQAARAGQMASGSGGTNFTQSRRKKKGGKAPQTPLAGTPGGGTPGSERLVFLERKVKELEQQNIENRSSEQSNRATLHASKKAKEAQEAQFSQQIEDAWQDVKKTEQEKEQMKAELDNTKASLTQEKRRLVNATRDATHAVRESGSVRQELQTLAVWHASEMASLRSELAEARATSEALRSAPPEWCAKMTPRVQADSEAIGPARGVSSAGDTEAMLLQLHALVNSWSSMLMPADKGHAHLYAFGSYLLVGDPESKGSTRRRGSDVDVLVVVPSGVPGSARGIKRKYHFFGKQGLNAKEEQKAAKEGVLAAILTRDDRVKHVMCARDAFVPCLRLEFMGVDIDLTLATLELEALPPQQVSQPFWALRPPPQEFLEAAALPPKDAFIESYRSMNGVLTTHAILRAVPSMELFRTVLVSVRRWAKARGLYGPTFGFPAGITWAMLTAAVCQRLPATTPPATVLSNFFHMWSTWPFPDPVEIAPGGGAPKEEGPNELDSEAWHPKISGGIMPVLTPCYPSIDACHLMPSTAFDVVCEELRRADTFRATQTAAGAWATSGGPLGHLWATQWCDTLGKEDIVGTFFKDYSHYIQLSVANEMPKPKAGGKKKPVVAAAAAAATAAAAQANTAQQHSQWAVLVQSQLRRLILRLDAVRVEWRHVTALRPFPRSFPGSTPELVYYVGLELAPGAVTQSPSSPKKHDDDEDVMLKFGSSTSPNPSPKGSPPAMRMHDADASAVATAAAAAAAVFGDEDLAAVSHYQSTALRMPRLLVYP